MSRSAQKIIFPMTPTVSGWGKGSVSQKHFLLEIASNVQICTGNSFLESSIPWGGVQLQ